MGIRRFIGGYLLRLAVRVLGRSFIDEIRSQVEEDEFESDPEDVDAVAFPVVSLNARAREMTERRRVPETEHAPPKPLAGSIADRAARSRR